MNAIDLVRSVPDGTMFPKAAVIELLQKAGEVEEGTPGQVAKLLGRSAKYWRGVAPEISGAYQEDSGRWRLPLAACRAHLARKRAKREGPRGPYRKAATTQATRFGTSRLQARPVLVDGRQAVDGETDRASRPIAPGLAIGRSANGQ